jgi:hypothetical protein
VCVCVFYSCSKIEKQKNDKQDGSGPQEHGGQPTFSPRGMHPSKVLQDDNCCLQDLLGLLRILWDLLDGKHPKIHEGVGGLYDQQRQLPDLDGMLLLSPGYKHT